MIFTGDLLLQPQGAGQDFPGQEYGVSGLHDRLLRLGYLGLGSHMIQVGDFTGLKKASVNLANSCRC